MEHRIPLTHILNLGLGYVPPAQVEAEAPTHPGVGAGGEGSMQGSKHGLRPGRSKEPDPRCAQSSSVRSGSSSTTPVCHFRHITWPSSDIQTVISLGSSAVTSPCSRACMLPTCGTIAAQHLKSLPKHQAQRAVTTQRTRR